MLSANQLVTELNGWGVHFVTGGDAGSNAPTLSPAELLAYLARQSEARLRLALIPLLLCHPEFASAVTEALSRLNEPAQAILKLYYTAAVLLQYIYRARLRDLLGPSASLPDLFSTELLLPPTARPTIRLKHLGERHRALSGLAANWVGTYTHAAERLLTRLEKEVQWQQN
jgi:hypothetical protein